MLGFYDECLAVMAQVLGVPVAERCFDCEWAITPDDREYFGFRMSPGTIACQKSTWTARVADQEEPAVAAIPAVHAAPPGIRTYADLPLITARYAPVQT